MPSLLGRLPGRPQGRPQVLSAFCCTFGCLFHGFAPDVSGLYVASVVLALGAVNFWTWGSGWLDGGRRGIAMN